MNPNKLEEMLTENMKVIFGFALTRLNNVPAAEELASDILYRLVRSADRIKDEKRFYGFMWKVAENTYKSYLAGRIRERERYAETEEDPADESASVEDAVIHTEDLNRMRRELSLLSGQYRKATVYYYIEEFSCSEIAEKLNISTEMVKYFLFRARKMIREGMNMERIYGEKSYRPENFEIDFWGTKAGDDGEWRAFSERKIKGNILLAAYYSPMSAQEISLEMGVALPYLEDELELLIKRQYLVEKNGKYLTNIPIFTPETTGAIREKIKNAVANTAEKLMELADGFQEKFGARFANENLMRWQKLLLCFHFALLDSEKAIRLQYRALPETGPYSLVTGGGRGVIWGKAGEKKANDIQGIYNGISAKGLNGGLIAMNFCQTMNGQDFQGILTRAVIGAALDDGALSDEDKNKLEKLGYLREGKVNFPVYSAEEYESLREVLADGIRLCGDLQRETYETAAEITADLAPAHIRSAAEYVGALVYRFRAMDDMARALFEAGWVKSVENTDKPGVCVVKNN